MRVDFESQRNVVSPQLSTASPLSERGGRTDGARRPRARLESGPTGRNRLAVKPLRNLWTIALASLGLVLLTAGPTSAQGRPGVAGLSVSTMLIDKSVQKEIKASPEQVEKLESLVEKLRAKQRETIPESAGLSDDERRKLFASVMSQLRTDLDKGVAEILKPEQTKRIQQIELQHSGVQGLLIPSVANKLKLTDAQKSDIREIYEHSMREMREAFQSANEDRKAAMEKVIVVRRQYTEKAQKVLNEEQLNNWKEMLGAPFEWPPRRP